MEQGIRYVGLDVDAESIAVAVAEGRDDVRFMGTIANRPEAVRKLVRRLGDQTTLRVCYEAGPTGYGLYWLLESMGVSCRVVAPSLLPKKPGDRVKTNRRDAEKLACSYRSGDLSWAWVPDREHEALRDLVRAREAAKADELRARHRLTKFLLRHGRRAPAGVKRWSGRYMAWLREQVKFDYFAQQAVLEDSLLELAHMAERLRRLEDRIDDAVAEAPAPIRAVIEGLQALRGVAQVTAATLACEVGRFSRFQRAMLLMGYSGMVPSEHSTGQRVRRGGITKTGNRHIRRVGIQSSWAYRFPPRVGRALRKRHEGLSEEVKQIAWRAQHRLHDRYRHLIARGKTKQQAITAVGRELLGFAWAIGVAIERQAATPQS